MAKENISKNDRQKRPSWIRHKLVRSLLCLLLVCGLLLLGINVYVCMSTASLIQSDQTLEASEADAILVLGCGVHSLTPSPMLEDRLDRAIALYKSGVAPKLLMSGDHGEQYYNEVGVMKAYAMEQGVPASDIFMDHAGFSTYESLYRAKEIFGCDTLVVVTQKYHLYRTLYLGNRLGISVQGVAADTTRYAGQTYRDLREILARDKDFFTGFTQPVPDTAGGEKIDISGDGNVTNDEAFLQIAEQKGIFVTIA